MTKVKRKIIKIDEEKCNGCGNCIPSCPEQAMQIVDTPKGPKARLVKEFYCDGLGACLGSCPTGALTIEERETDVYDEEATIARIKEMTKIPSELRQWPIQLHLVPPLAPYFQNQDLLIVADCVPFAYANFHQDFLKGKASPGLAIGCPKLDDVDAYIEKVTQIIKTANPKSIKVVHMEVPCCSGLVHIVKQALNQAKKDIPFEEITIGIKGEIK